MKKVMILEDEVSIRSFVVINLKRAGYEVVEAGTGEEALELLKSNPDVGVAILDIMLPGIDGFEVCRSIRVTDKKIGIIMLTARSQEMDKITGLMTGADDYMTKPFSPAELTARIDALYRRIDSDGTSNQVALFTMLFLWLNVSKLSRPWYCPMPLAPMPPKPIWLVARCMIVSLTQPPPKGT